MASGDTVGLNVSTDSIEPRAEPADRSVDTLLRSAEPVVPVLEIERRIDVRCTAAKYSALSSVTSVLCLQYRNMPARFWCEPPM